MPGPKLTADERADILDRYRRGAGCRVIARAIQRSYGAVRAVVAAAGIMRPRGGPRARTARAGADQ